MDDKRRARIQVMRDQLDQWLFDLLELKKEEQTAFEAMPGSIQRGLAGDKADAAFCALEQASELFEKVDSRLSEAME